MQLLFNVVMNCFFFFLFLNSPKKHKDTSNFLLAAVCTCSFSICKLSNISYSIHCLASCGFFFGSFVNNFFKIFPDMHLQTAWNKYIKKNQKIVYSCKLKFLSERQYAYLGCCLNRMEYCTWNDTMISFLKCIRPKTSFVSESKRKNS